jgi:hypothetical protein
LLIPVQFTVELFSRDEWTAGNLDVAVTAFNGELRAYFRGQATVIGLPAKGVANLIKVDTSVNAEGEVVIVATVVLGLLDVSFEEADRLAKQFSSASFPRSVVAASGAGEFDRLRGLGAFGDVTAAAQRSAAARINEIIGD